MSTEAASDTPTHSAHRTRSVGDAVSMYEVGSVVSGYRIEQVLATGATGTVYLAKNPTLPRRDALKVLSAELSHDPAFRERFVREGDVAALLEHPNIVSIYNRGESEDGQLWIAMQYIAGTDAEAALQDGAMNPKRALRIVSEVAKALDYAHQNGVIHHDVKPGNVLLANTRDDEEQVLLSDFGVSHAPGVPADGADSIVAITLAYAAPEVIAGATIDGRADIYSLGCTLFRLLTGKQPFYRAEGTTALAMAHLHQPPPKVSDLLPQATRQLDVVMARAMTKKPQDRFASAREFAAAATAAANSLTENPTAAPTRSAIAATSDPLQPTTSRHHTDGFHAPIRIDPVPPRRRTVRWQLLALWAVFAVLALVAIVLWTKVLAPSPTPSETASPEPSTPAATALDLLEPLLPQGYPRGVCAPATAEPGMTAAVSCGPNVDPGGPTSSMYMLSEDAEALNDAFTDLVNQSTVMICPPNNQSPGPWRKVAQPDVVQGTVFCGIQSGRPIVAWTNDDERLLSIVRTATSDATLVELFTWWSSHS